MNTKKKIKKKPVAKKMPTKLKKPAATLPAAARRPAAADSARPAASSNSDSEPPGGWPDPESVMFLSQWKFITTKTHSIFTVVQHASWSFEDWTHTLADASNTRGDDDALMHYSLLPTRFSIQQYLKPLKFLSQKTLRKWSDFVLLRMADLMGKDQVQKKLKTLRTVYSFFAGIDCQRFAWKMITGSCERLWGFRPMILFDSAVNDSVMSIFSKQWCQNNLLDSTLRLYQTIDLTYFFTSLGLNIIEGWEEEEQAGHDDRLAPTEQFLCVRRHLGHDFQQSVRKWFVGSQKNHLEENSLVRQTSERMLGLASRAKSVWAWRLGQVRTFQYEPRLKDSI